MFKDFFNSLKNYFHFTQKEFVGFNVLSIVLLILVFTPLLVQHLVPGKGLVQESDYRQLDSIITVLESKNKIALFYFNPNSLTSDSMYLLGLPMFVINNWKSYRSSGGSFIVKKDFRKIYGLSEENFLALQPYILLPDSIATDDSKSRAEPDKIVRIDINKATSDDLIPIYGIGEKLAMRIIKYRDLLGGFVNKEQYREVYFLSETAKENLEKYTYIRSNYVPERIKINEDEYPDILRHPYISKELTDKVFRKRENDSLVNTLILKDLIRNDSVYFDLLPYIEF